MEPLPDNTFRIFRSRPLAQPFPWRRRGGRKATFGHTPSLDLTGFGTGDQFGEAAGSDPSGFAAAMHAEMVRVDDQPDRAPHRVRVPAQHPRGRRSL